LPATGLTITQHAGTITTDTPSAGAVTCNFATSDKHSVTLAASTTFTFSNPTAGQIVVIMIIQGGSGSYTATWPGTVDWGAAGAPTLSTAVNDIDIITMLYDGTKYRAGVFGLGY
jgi:cell wall-associated NlpC family hydrolase